MHCPKCETTVDKLPYSISRWTHYECVECKAKLNRKSIIPQVIGTVIIPITGVLIGIIIWHLFLYKWIDRKYTILIEMPKK